MEEKRTTFLEKLKVKDLAGDVPSISIEVAKFLHTLILEKKCQSVLEIGCAHAYSTIWIADALETTKGHIHTIDHSTPSFKIAQENIATTGLTNVTMHFGRAQEIIQNMDQMFDFIFIDGIKKSTLEFFEICTPKLNSGGIIVVDDVLKFRYKMEAFWNFLESQTEWHYEIHPLDLDDGIMVITKNKNIEK